MISMKQKVAYEVATEHVAYMLRWDAKRMRETIAELKKNPAWDPAATGHMLGVAQGLDGYADMLEKAREKGDLPWEDQASELRKLAAANSAAEYANV